MKSVAILLPTFNSAKMLKNCLISIQNQTYKNFVCFILDDGSTDETDLVVKEFLFDKRFVYKKYNINRGITSVLNDGLKLVKQFDFIARMDADDIMAKERLFIQVNFLENNKEIQIVSSTITDSLKELNKEKNSNVLCDSKEVFSNLISKNIINHPTVMVRTELLLKNPYSENFPLLEDYELWSRIVTPTNSMILECPLVLYNSKLRKFGNFHNSLNIKLNFIKRNNMKVALSVINQLHPYSLGIEKTLAYRSNNLSLLNLVNFTIITNPVILPDLRFHFCNRLEFRQDSTFVLPNMCSDIGMDWCCYSLDDYLEDNPEVLSVRKINEKIVDVITAQGLERLNIRNGYVVQSLYFDKNKELPKYYKLYSSGLYLIKDYEKNELTYFNKDKTVALKITNNKWLFKGKHEIKEEDVLFMLINKLNPQMIIRDRFNESYLELSKYAKKNKIPYIGYLHYSPLNQDDEIVDSVKFSEYDVMVSSNRNMIKKIKTEKETPIIYIPPIYVKEDNSKKTNNKFIMLTSDSSKKS